MSYKIFIISYTYDKIVKGDMGGHRKVWEIAENLKLLGHDVTVFIPDYEYCSSEINATVKRVKAVKLPFIRSITFGIFLFVKLIKESKQRKPDFIYCRPIHSPIPVLFSKIKKVKIFFEMNNNPYQNLTGRLSIRYFYNWFINHFNYLFADNIIVINSAVKRLIEQKHKINGIKIKVIGNCSNTELFKPMDLKICRAKVGIDGGMFVAGFVGTMFYYQGISLAIDAAPLIIREISNVHFLLVGDGTARSGWQETIKQRGLEKYFTFTGQVPYKDVPKYINAMDVCIAPLLSNRDEASPLKIFDCLSCGKPVIVSGIEPLKELIEEISELIVFKADDPADFARSLIKLAHSKEKIAELGIKAREYVLNGHSWPDHCKKIIEVYEEK